VNLRVSESAAWDQRYREGTDGWELGRPAPSPEQFLRADPRRPLPPGRVLVPGCGRGHEANLLTALGFEAIGLDFSPEAIGHARRLYGAERSRLRWLQADLFDVDALPDCLHREGSLRLPRCHHPPRRLPAPYQLPAGCARSGVPRSNAAGAVGGEEAGDRILSGRIKDNT